jgi:hypothetical protein
MMKKALSLFALLVLLATPAWSQQRHQATMISGYNVASASYIYGAYADSNASILDVTSVFGPGSPKNLKVQNVAAGVSSANVVASVANSAPFVGIVAGDLLLFNINGVEYERTVTTWTNANTIVVDSAIQLGATGGVTFRYKKLYMGVETTDGWFNTGSFNDFDIQADVNTLAAASIDFVLECRDSKLAKANQIFTKNFSAVGSTAVAVSVRKELCRIGWKVNGDAGDQSVAAYIITAGAE